MLNWRRSSMRHQIYSYTQLHIYTLLYTLKCDNNHLYLNEVFVGFMSNKLILSSDMKKLFLMLSMKITMVMIIVFDSRLSVETHNEFRNDQSKHAFYQSITCYRNNNTKFYELDSIQVYIMLQEFVFFFWSIVRTFGRFFCCIKVIFIGY